METIIEVKNLVKNYGDKEILKNISFNINKGEIISIIGESGAGKSTLMRCLNGLENINSGSIKFYDTDITKLKEKEKNSIKKQMAYVFQDLNIIDNMYVIENVLVPFLNRKNFIQVLFNKFSKQEYERALYCLEKVGISKLAYTKAKYLSGGEKQRVAIARSLAPNVDLILADEPISSLDEKNSTQIMEIFKRINIKKNKTIILNLHNVEVAKKFSDKILALKNGKIFFYKKSAEVNEDDIRKVYQTS
ncbi:phosphonate ABC transporter ATP-binding protein [Fusobacterium hwasookii]|uniref:Phosphonate ABC transporter ATP-binding protein n=1 Tax=Fusobacterium hwasookii ChDC F206 TaxID=1307443 RepID=A0AAC9A1M3_9FUSO|nr:phosphonate ABC transporter ATP-binding protein [Fusobacterium hwasookii]ALQ36111.1 phosphonate ABC transporter ATP-binding protein [Fusobacterium hwasookii ChDC F206]ALQ37262.1 phosphonate ABC transporter ATP-binding protein [Fusobacterium hwasookii ChDC F300]QNE67789.1 phosphonate ABC transporter ATP-binding protein [Fusobacterium hwasookii]